MHLSVIIPAYNEEKRIARTLEEIDKYLSKQAYDYEIIVVSDGSKDKTAEVARGLRAKIKNLKIIDNQENHGKGYVVRQGLLASQGDYRLFTDADNSTSVDQIEKMWPEFEKGYDVVIGSRDIKGAVLDPPQPFRRRILGNIFNLLTQFIIGLWGVWDTQCGFKGITKRAAESVLPEMTIDRWAFDPEILIVARKKGFKIKEVPVRWENDLSSKVKFSGMVKMFFELLQIRLNLIKGKYGTK